MSVALSTVHKTWYKDLLGGVWNNYGSIDVGLCEIGPDTAQLILEHHNTKNRRMQDRQVQLLVRDILEGHYLLTGETILFDWDRVLLNGQNRLQAVVNSQKSITQLVVVNLDPEVFKVLDQQSKRTVGQILSLMGETRGNDLSSAISFLGQMLRSGEIFDRGQRSTAAFTVQEKLEYLTQYPKLRESLAYTAAYKNQTRIFPGYGLASVLHHLTVEAKPNLAKRFWEAIFNFNLENEDRFSSVQLLLKRLTANLTDVAKLRGRTIAALTIKAWNSYARNEKMDALRYTEAQKEKFPRIEGLKYKDGGGIQLD